MTRTLPLALLLCTSLLLPPVAAQDRKANSEDQVTVRRDVEYGKAGRRSLKLDIVTPKAKSDRPRPCIVFIHGGGWQNGNKSGGIRRVMPYVAGGEYVGVSVGYRLSGEAIWPAQIHDCKASIRWIRASAKRYNIDPDKIGVWGISAGGHLVSLLGTSGGVKKLAGSNGSADHSSRVSCVVDYCGPSDFVAFSRQSARIAAPDSAVSKLLGGAVQAKLELAKVASPATYISKDDPPFLVVHGTRDNLVPIAQAEDFHKALTKAGVDSTYIKIIGSGHVPRGPGLDERVKNFFDKHLRGKEVQISGKPIQVPEQ